MSRLMRVASQVNVSVVVDDNGTVVSRMMKGKGKAIELAQEIIGRQRRVSELNFHVCVRKGKLSRDLDHVEWKESAPRWIIIDDYRHVVLPVTAETWRHQDKEQSLMSNWSSASSSLLDTKLQVENVSVILTTNFVRNKWEAFGNSLSNRKTSSACTAEKERERKKEREKKGCDKIIKQVAACATLLLLPLLQLLFLPFVRLLLSLLLLLLHLHRRSRRRRRRYRRLLLVRITTATTIMPKLVMKKRMPAEWKEKREEKLFSCLWAYVLCTHALKTPRPQ